MIAGAAAMVYVLKISPPGFFSYSHASWDRCESCGDSMSLVGATDPDNILGQILSKGLEPPVVCRAIFLNAPLLYKETHEFLFECTLSEQGDSRARARARIPS